MTRAPACSRSRAAPGASTGPACGRCSRATRPFETREHRGAPDAVNSALNYGYGILYTQVWGAIMNAGLEPFAGFLHVDRPGKPSLVLDLIEEFRQPIVDRAVIAALTKGLKLETREGLLTDESRRAVAGAVLERLESEVALPRPPAPDEVGHPDPGAERRELPARRQAVPRLRVQVVRGQELLTFVIYDIVDDRVRGRVANACKDYGLERIQYSAFCGSLDATRRERAGDAPGGHAGHGDSARSSSSPCARRTSGRSASW